MDFSLIDIDSYDKTTFGKCIREQREEVGISLRKTASMIGISATYLSDIEKGERNAPTSKNNIHIIENLIEVLGIPNEQKQYVYNMAYATRTSNSDVIEYISECKEARDFLRRAKRINLSSDNWETLNMFLTQIDNQDKNKVISKKRKR